MKYNKIQFRPNKRKLYAGTIRQMNNATDILRVEFMFAKGLRHFECDILKSLTIQHQAIFWGNGVDGGENY